MKSYPVKLVQVFLDPPAEMIEYTIYRLDSYHSGKKSRRPSTNRRVLLEALMNIFSNSGLRPPSRTFVFIVEIEKVIVEFEI